MKKALLFYIAILFFGVSKAQLSDNTKPFSFTYNISKINKITSFSEKINLPLFNLDSLKREDTINDTKKGVYRFGYNHIVNLNTDNSGSWTELQNGDKVWQLEISSHNAKTLNLAFSDFKLPEGSKLWVFNLENNDYIGAFNSDINSEDGYFATDIIIGNSLIIEYYLPAGVSQKNPFTLFRVTHGYRGFGIKSDEKLFGDAGSCNVNINCPTGNNWQDQKRSSAFTIGSTGNEVCSGALINNVLNDGTPYFLTANHCYNSFGNLSLMVFKFNFEAAACTYTSGASPSHDALTGASLVAKNSASDFCLLLLKDNLPSSYNLFLSGWNRAGSLTDSVVCIHHPAGDVTKISFAPTATAANYSGAQTWKTGTWGDIDGDDISDGGGVTEGGSSGSPLYDENKRIIGQLYGGPSSCSATGTNRLDYFGRVETSWNTGATPETRLRDWLDPCNTDAMAIDGILSSQIATYNNEAELVKFVSPESNSSTCSNNVSAVVTIKNNGINNITSISFNYAIGSVNGSIIKATTIAAGASLNISLSNITTITYGAQVLSITIAQVNGNVDENLCNNYKAVAFTVIDVSGTTVSSFTEDFEGATFPPNNFTLNNPDSGSPTWEKSNTNGGFGTSSKSMKMNFWTSTNGNLDYFYSPNFSLNDKTEAKITFDLAHKRYSTTIDSLIVSISEDCGVSWVDLYKKGGATLATAGSSFSQYNTTAAGDWRSDTIKLDNFINKPVLQIRFKARSNNGNNLYIDNINLFSAKTIPVVVDGILEKNNSTIFVYPNPADNSIFISNPEFTMLSVEVYSYIGTLVKTEKLNNNNLQKIDISNLSSGMYFVKIKGDTKTYNLKFIKN